MILNRSALFLLAAVTTAASAQTTPSTTPKKATTATHRSTTAAKTAATPAAAPVAAASLKDTPPGVPKVEGTPKPLYALRYIDTVIGTGPIAVPRKYYTVHYTGWTTDGTKFDSSVDRGEPITFPYGARQVIPGWDTGFEDMHVGGKRRLYIPYQLAYGADGRPPVIPAKADLIFDIELIGMSDTPPTPPPAPAATDAPSADPSAAPAKPSNPTAPAQKPEEKPKGI
jgi:peptidylprolyl isomerase